MNSVLDFFSAPWFWAGLLSWCVAQTIKMTVDFFRTHRIDFSYFVSTGGMPSAHSAMVSGLATSIGLTEGFGSPICVLAAAFAVVTMFDAAGVRNAAGQQARLLNQMVDELFTEHKFNTPRLKELLGHTRLEVFAGLLTGIGVSLFIMSQWWPDKILP